jgi:N,N'-diacetylchitobiose transport system permease protein
VTADAPAVSAADTRSAAVPRAASARRRRRRRFGRTGWNVVALLLLVVMIFPVYWMVSTAFQPTDRVNSLTPAFLPTHPTLQHFRDAIDRPYFWNSVKNSVFIVGITVAISIVLSFLAAVALARYRFAGRKLFIVVLIGIQMLPQVGLIIPLYVVLSRYQLTRNQYVLLGVIITYMTFALPFAVWTLRGFLLNIPKELEEAAMVDGSSRLGAFVRILLPLVAPGLVATSVFVFVTSWNEFIFAYVLLNDQSKQTVTVWLSQFYGTSRQVDWGGLMAGSVLAAIPVLIFFGFVQRKIAFGLTAGAVKG